MHRVMRCLRSSSDHEHASRAELHVPKIGACVSPAPLSALSKYRLFTPSPLQRWSPRSYRLSGWLQVIGKGLYSVANCVLALIEHLRTSDMFRKAILWVTPMPTSTLPWPTSRSRRKETSSNVVHSIVGGLLDGIRVLFSITQLLWWRDGCVKWKYQSRHPLGRVIRKLGMQCTSPFYSGLVELL
jgi:hypothetical protein